MSIDTKRPTLVWQLCSAVCALHQNFGEDAAKTKITKDKLMIKKKKDLSLDQREANMLVPQDQLQAKERITKFLSEFFQF